MIERGEFLTVGEQFRRYTPQLERNAGVLDKDKTERDPCITWLRSKRGHGMKKKRKPGQVRVTMKRDGKSITKTMAAHRHAWNVVYGVELPEDKALIADCGSALCLNVNHHFVADVDMTSKYRKGTVHREEMELHKQRDEEDQMPASKPEALDG